MATEENIRALLIQQLGVSSELIDQLPLIDIALALAEVLGIAFPLYRLRQLHGYGDLARAARDAVNDRLVQDGALYVRARLRAASVNVMRVGALTPAFVAAIADDLRQAPAGVEIAVPDDVSDAVLIALRRRLAWLLGAAAPLVVCRAADLGPDTPAPWDRMTQGSGRARGGALRMPHAGGGITIAVEDGDTLYERRRFPT